MAVTAVRRPVAVHRHAVLHPREAVDRPLARRAASPIHGLYFYDYVTEVDVNRWYVAQRREEARLSMKADDRDKEKISSR
jgi:hypothetical protein